MICLRKKCILRIHSQKAVEKRFFVIMKLRFIDNKGEKHDIRRNPAWTKGKKKYVRTGWDGAENYVQLFDTIEQNGVALEVTPYFLINVSGEGEGFSMWSPTPCDVLATDWVEVHD